MDFDDEPIIISVVGEPGCMEVKPELVEIEDQEEPSLIEKIQYLIAVFCSRIGGTSDQWIKSNEVPPNDNGPPAEVAEVLIVSMYTC